MSSGREHGISRLPQSPPLHTWPQFTHLCDRLGPCNHLRFQPQLKLQAQEARRSQIKSLTSQLCDLELITYIFFEPPLIPLLQDRNERTSLLVMLG